MCPLSADVGLQNESNYKVLSELCSIVILMKVASRSMGSQGVALQVLQDLGSLGVKWG